MERERLILALRSARADLAAEGISHLALFGSRARGDHHRESDIDLLIEVDRPQQFSLLDLVGVEQLVADRIGIPANVFMRRSLAEQFRESIETDIIEIF